MVNTGIPVFLVLRELWLGCFVLMAPITIMRAVESTEKGYLDFFDIVFTLLDIYVTHFFFRRYTATKKQYIQWLDSPQKFSGVVPIERNQMRFIRFMLLFVFIIHSIPETIKIWLYPTDTFILHNLSFLLVIILGLAFYTEACSSIPPSARQRKTEFAPQAG